MIEHYLHHGKEVAVLAHLRGTHRESCLCFRDCRFFRPGQADNCEIAQAVYDNCVKFGVTTPVFECPKFQTNNQPFQ